MLDPQITVSLLHLWAYYYKSVTSGYSFLYKEKNSFITPLLTDATKLIKRRPKIKQKRQRIPANFENDKIYVFYVKGKASIKRNTKPQKN